MIFGGILILANMFVHHCHVVEKNGPLGLCLFLYLVFVPLKYLLVVLTYRMVLWYCRVGILLTMMLLSVCSGGLFVDSDLSMQDAHFGVLCSDCASYSASIVHDGSFCGDNSIMYPDDDGSHCCHFSDRRFDTHFNVCSSICQD